MKNANKVGEIMSFSLEFPKFCGENTFAVEDASSSARIWEGGVDIGCDKENEFLDRKQIQHITTEHPIPGGFSIHADPVITSYEGTFRFVYEAEDIRKEWNYQVFERIPLHLDQAAHIRIAIYALGYIVFTLYVYKDDLSKRLRK